MAKQITITISDLDVPEATINEYVDYITNFLDKADLVAVVVVEDQKTEVELQEELDNLERIFLT